MMGTMQKRLDMAEGKRGPLNKSAYVVKRPGQPWQTLWSTGLPKGHNITTAGPYSSLGIAATIAEELNKQHPYTGKETVNKRCVYK